MAKINDSTIIYNTRPAGFGASKWLDASYTGNGKVTAAVLGAYSNEEILLGRTELKHGGYTGVLQDVSDKFPAVRRAYTEGKILEAEKLLSSEFTRKGYAPQTDRPLPLAIISMDFNVEGFVTGYRRTTDMKSGEVEVTFKHGSTISTRGLFVGRNNDLVVYSVAKNGPDKINMHLSVKIPEGVKLLNSITKYEGGFTYFASRSHTGSDYGFVARIVATTGMPVHFEGGITLKANEGFTLFIKTFNESNRDTEFKNIKAELMAIKNSYDKLLGQHEGAHRKMFDACTLELNGSNETKEDITALLSKVNEAELDSALVERLWNAGKYLSICGVPPGYASFNNTAQLLYSGIMSSVAPELVLSFFEIYERYTDDLKKNASRVYGLRGYFIPSVTSPKSALFGAVDPGTIHFIASSALAANVFYKYYLVTGDTKILKTRIFPFMREIWAFYSDFLKLDSGGYYTTVPSYSPSSTPGNIISGKPLQDFAFATNSTIDFLAIGSLLDNLIEAAGICGASDEVPAWQDMKTKIPSLGINDMGALREYTNSVFIDGAVNCGTMHAYGLWPIKNISFNDVTVPYRPAVAQGAAAQNSVMGLARASYNAVVTRLNKSGPLQNAQTLSMCATQVAHAGLEESAQTVREILLKLLASCFTPSGLCLSNDWRGGGFTRHGEVRLDMVGNVGFANAITECIIQSNQRVLRILPCIFEDLNSGRITDIATDFGARVSIDWDIKKKRCIVKIVPKITCKINITVNTAFRKNKNKDLKMHSDINGLRDFPLVAGKAVALEFI